MKRNVSRKNGVAISTRIVGMAVMKIVPMPPARQINLGKGPSLYYVSIRTGWGGVRKVISFCWRLVLHIYADVGWMGWSEKVQKRADVIFRIKKNLGKKKGWDFISLWEAKLSVCKKPSFLLISVSIIFLIRKWRLAKMNFLSKFFNTKVGLKLSGRYAYYVN